VDGVAKGRRSRFTRLCSLGPTGPVLARTRFVNRFRLGQHRADESGASVVQYPHAALGCPRYEKSPAGGGGYKVPAASNG
jgi:hypothetical protein